MSQWPLIGVALLGLAALVYCIPHASHHIHEDIETRTTAALAAANVAIPPGGISVDGRDVILTGPRGSAIVSDATRDKVAKVWGVRDPVHVIVTEPPPAPAPPPLPVEARKLEVDLTNFLEGKNIHFAVTSDVILPDGKIVLNEVFRILASAPSVAVDISGHTDTDGDAKSNLDLSQRRATAVKQYLVTKGIAAARMNTAGYGSTQPVAPNDTPINKARNRRIEFHATSRIPGAALSNQ